MPKYNEFYYQNGYYGVRSVLAYSAEPITATALDYNTVLVEFLTPTGTYSDFRLVRSQLGIPQTQEDGAVIYSSVGPPTNTSIEDSTTSSIHPLIYGRFVFYRAWVRKTESSYWVPAGDAFTLLPSPHSLGVGRDAVYSGPGLDGVNTDDVLLYSDSRVNPFVSTTHERFMAMLPRVLTTATNSGADTINDGFSKDAHDTGLKDNSLISTFLSAFSFTFDEFLTFASLITPDTSVHWASPTSVYLGSHQLGMTLDVEPVTATQRRLLRNAVNIYQSKGTAPGLELFFQSMTSYDVTLTDTTNLMPTVGDATFNFINWEEGQPVGGWRSLSPDLTLSVDTNQSPSVGDKSLDTVYCAKITQTTAGGSIGLGNDNPIVDGIPITESLPYTLNYFIQTGPEVEGGEPVGSDNVSVTLNWFDRFGEKISSNTTVSTVEGWGEVNPSYPWGSRVESTATAPIGAKYMGIVLSFNQLYPVYIDSVSVTQESGFLYYEEPRGVNILVNPTKVNYIKNPNFQVSTDYWETNPGTDDVLSIATEGTDGVVSRSGPSVLKGTVGGATSSDFSFKYFDFDALDSDENAKGRIAVSPGEYYSASIYVKDGNTGAPAILSMSFYEDDFTDTPIESVDSEEFIIDTTNWTRAQLSVKAPLNATFAQISVTMVGASTADRYAFFDAAQFEKAYLPTDYFDGYLRDDGGEWMGGASQSFSANYPAKSTRLLRIENEIQQYLGFDTPFYVSTAEGPYVSGIS